MSQKIRIKLKSYDHNLVDKSAEKIVKTVKATGAIVSGPIPLPTHKRIFTVNRSTFVNKKSREQFQLSSFKRLIDISSSSIVWTSPSLSGHKPKFQTIIKRGWLKINLASPLCLREWIIKMSF